MDRARVHAFVLPIHTASFVTPGNRPFLRVCASHCARVALIPRRWVIEASANNRSSSNEGGYSSQTTEQDDRVLEAESKYGTELKAESRDDAYAEREDEEEHEYEMDDSDSGDAGGNDNGNSNYSGDGDKYEGDGDEHAKVSLSVPTTPRAMRRAGKYVVQEAGVLANIGKNVAGFVGYCIKVVLQVVPAQVLVALISVLSTVAGWRFQSRNQKIAQERERRERAVRRKAEIEAELRGNYQQLANSLLISAVTLSERLSMIVQNESFFFVDSGYTDCGQGNSAVYATYLLARYLATVELLKKRSSVLDLGFPAADRIFINILGRVQGILSADCRTLRHMQETERFFKPEEGQETAHAGPLRIMPRAQVSLGQWLLRRHWKSNEEVEKLADGVEGDGKGQALNHIVSYAEFTDLLCKHKSMERWFMPVIQSFKKLEKESRKGREERLKNSSNGNGEYQPGDYVGARVFFLQSALMDLVDFLDPGPRARFIPMHKRQRLRLGSIEHLEDQRMPESLQTLYENLATLRDHRVHDGSFAQRIRSNSRVEVYTKAAVKQGGTDVIQRDLQGDCPFSHRVQLVLEEMGVPYRNITISADAKPSWFHLLHAENTTPVIYHEGQIVDDSNQIVEYLFQKFPSRRCALASTDHLNLSVGTASFTRFHSSFIGWLATGSDRAKRKLENELRLLNAILVTARERNGAEAPFLGGKRFSSEDTAIVPVLNNVDIAGRHLKQWCIPRECIALKEYLQAARVVPSFQRTAPKEEAVVNGYDRLIKHGPEKALRLANILE